MKKSPQSALSTSRTLRKAPETAHPLDLAQGRRVRSTTVLCVRRGDQVVMAADGQVTLGATVMKSSARKLRRLGNDKAPRGLCRIDS